MDSYAGLNPERRFTCSLPSRLAQAPSPASHFTLAIPIGSLGCLLASESCLSTLLIDHRPLLHPLPPPPPYLFMCFFLHVDPKVKAGVLAGGKQLSGNTANKVRPRMALGWDQWRLLCGACQRLMIR